MEWPVEIACKAIAELFSTFSLSRSLLIGLVQRLRCSLSFSSELVPSCPRSTFDNPHNWPDISRYSNRFAGACLWGARVGVWGYLWMMKLRVSSGGAECVVRLQMCPFHMGEQSWSIWFRLLLGPLLPPSFVACSLISCSCFNSRFSSRCSSEVTTTTDTNVFLQLSLIIHIVKMPPGNNTAPAREYNPEQTRGNLDKQLRESW